MSYCLNPDCCHPENPDNYSHCQGCGSELAESSESYLFYEHYLLVQLLEENTLGRTYLIYDTELDILQKPRSLRQLIFSEQVEDIKQAKEQFKEQCKKLQNLNHFQIPKIYDFFTDNNYLYIVEEFLSGKTLQAELRESKVFSEKETLALLREILLIAQYLHANNIIHGDIEPANILRPITTNIIPKKQDNKEQNFTKVKVVPESDITVIPAGVKIEPVVDEPLIEQPEPSFSDDNNVNKDFPVFPDPFLDTPENEENDGMMLPAPLAKIEKGSLTHSNFPVFPDPFLDAQESVLTPKKYHQSQPKKTPTVTTTTEVILPKRDALWTLPFGVKLLGLIYRSRMEYIHPVLWIVVVLGEMFKEYKKTSQGLLSLDRGKKIILMNLGKTKLLSLTKQQPETDFYSPFYAPKEQMDGQPIPASDIYSLGVICLRMLTGDLPHLDEETGNWVDPLYSSEQQQLLWRERLAEQDILLSRNFKTVLDRMLKPLPVDRYQSAAEVLTALYQTDPDLSQLLIERKARQRRRFLKLAGWGGVGLLITAVAADLLSRGKPWEKLLTSFSFEVFTVNAMGEIIKRQKQQARSFTVDIGEGVTMEFVAIAGGKFLMGSPYTEKSRGIDEGPQTEIEVASFFMGKYPVTQIQWKAVMGKNPSYFSGDNLPVDTVSWDDCVEFCKKLSRIVGRKCHLPSEAQWEYACRAGTTTPFHTGETLISQLANYRADHVYQSEPRGIYRQQTTDVGSFPPNAFGLHDFHGNVWEWCQDHKHKSYYRIPRDGRPWQDKLQEMRMLRGGAWLNYPGFCRSANRNSDVPSSALYSYGFRVAAIARSPLD